MKFDDLAMRKALEVHHLSVSSVGLDQKKLLDDLSFFVSEGETLALIGESGSGKSLTSLALMGLLPSGMTATGRIKLEGYPPFHPQCGKSFQQLRGKEISMIFQEPMTALNPLMTCGKQLVESIISHQHLSRGASIKKALAWLDNVQLPRVVFQRYPHQLSGGQKQRVMIAMAMCNSPKVLIGDEPTTALDVLVQKEIIDLMRHLQAEMGTALVFITHDIGLATQIADRFIILEEGRIIDRMSIAGLPEKNSAISDDSTLLRADRISVSYPRKANRFEKTQGRFYAVDAVSFEIKKGETLGLAGASGCGKSTIAKALVGLQPITSGSIVFGNKRFSNLSGKAWKQLRKDIQIVFQDPYSSLNPRLKVGDAIMEAMQVHLQYTSKEKKERMERLLESVHLPRAAQHKYPFEFSGGQRQRIVIARALAVEPKLLICDESVSALDTKTQYHILNLLKDLQAERQLTYLFISHDLRVMERMCTRLLIMKDGKIIENGDTAKLLRHPEQEYTKRLVDAGFY